MISIPKHPTDKHDIRKSLSNLLLINTTAIVTNNLSIMQKRLILCFKLYSIDYRIGFTYQLGIVCHAETICSTQ